MRKYRKPHRIKRKKSILKSRFLWSAIFALVLVGAGFYFFVFSEFFQVRDLIITGPEKVVSGDIESAIKRELDKSIFLVNPGKIREVVLQKFPQIKELEIKRRLPNILNLALAERKEVGVFCQGQRCFLLDGQGVMFEEFTGETSLPKLQNTTLRKELVLRESAFDKDTLERVLEINTKLKANLGIFPEELSLVSEERLNVITSEGWQVYFSIKRNVDWQIASLATILEKRIPPEKRKNLEYIDLRFDKIFVYPEI